MKPFQQQATEHLNRLRVAFAEFLSAAPGQVLKPVDLQKVLRLDMKLSWKVVRVATAPNPLAAGPYVPGAANIRTLLKAAARADMPEAMLDELRAAISDFEDFVKRSAGDRATFDSMVYSLAGSQEAEAFALQQRKAAFRANRHIYGSLCRAQSTLIFTQPNDEDSDLLDFAFVLGHAGLQRLRESAPLPSSFVGLRDDDYRSSEVDAEAVDHEASSGARLGLLREFCSQPLPAFEVSHGENGRTYGKLVTPDIGMMGALDWFTGSVMRGAAPRWRAENNLEAISRSESRIPAEAFYLTLLLREDTFGEVKPRLEFFLDTVLEPTDKQESQSLAHLLTTAEQPQYLGRGPMALQNPVLPRMAAMAAHVFKRLGWDGEAFDVHQVRIAYPVTPSTAFLRHDLPEKPKT